MNNVSSLLSKLDGNEHNSRCFFWTFDQNDSNNKPIVNLKKVFSEKKTTSEPVKELKPTEQKYVKEQVKPKLTEQKAVKEQKEVNEIQLDVVAVIDLSGESESVV